MNTTSEPNALINEKSPYLLQHAYNPVKWYPWAEEVLEKAKAEDKPIFLSIGYSTCHWCHVMERESFENEEIAKLLNEYFIPIKVDREERPDIDQVYMQAVMAMTGSGGWPMSVFLTPDQKPFYGGTYFPPEDKWGRPGFRTILEALSVKWKSERMQIEEAGSQMVDALQKQVEQKAASENPLGESVLQKAFEQYRSQFDHVDGGFGQAPKFPRTHMLSLLMRYAKRNQNEQAKEMVRKTLDAMANGGIYDHLGGGFHRYSTDGRWHIPHFEKMLYDQALILRSYIEGYQIFKDENYARIIHESLNYVLRDMTDEKGGFYSAEDADSIEDAAKPEHKKEGAFFVWMNEEVNELLTKEEAKAVKSFFDIQEGGNAQEDPHQEFIGKNILQILHSKQSVAENLEISEEELEKLLNSAKRKLFEDREKRPRPHLDDKVLVDWNGLMISTFAKSAQSLKEDQYLRAAKKSADFILENMIQQGRLMHRYREGEVAIQGFLDDYAFFILGLMDLYEASFEWKYLEKAIGLADQMVELFLDKERGGFYFIGSDQEHLVARIKETYDGAIPSGNSMAAMVLVRLAKMTLDEKWQRLADDLFMAFSEPLNRMPSAYPQMLQAFDFHIGPSSEIVIAGDLKDESFKIMREAMSELYNPNQVVLHHAQDEEAAKRSYQYIPFLEKQTMQSGKSTVYVCKNFECEFPVTNVEDLKKLLSN